MFCELIPVIMDQKLNIQEHAHMPVFAYVIELAHLSFNWVSSLVINSIKEVNILKVKSLLKEVDSQ